MGTVTKGFDANRQFFIVDFRHYGTQFWAPECRKVNK